MMDMQGGHPEVRTRVLIVIVNYKSAHLTIKCLRSLEGEVRDRPWIQVALVENASGEAEQLAAAIREHGWESWVHLVAAPDNGGFARGNNLAIRAALESADPPPYFLLLNPDTEVFPGAVAALVDFMDAHPEVGIAGSSFEDENGDSWPFAFRFPSVWSEFQEGVQLGLVTRLLKRHVVPRIMNGEEAPVDWVAGASMMVRKEVFDAVGLMDEGYFLYFEEVDFCRRARTAGWQCWYVPQSHVMHICGQSTGVSNPSQQRKRRPAFWYESRRRYFVKNHGWAGAVAADLARLAGHALWTVRRAVQRKPDNTPAHFFADLVRHSPLFTPRCKPPQPG